MNTRLKNEFHGRANARCGFTLIELIVVIGIIMLIAAILFPVFARARENAKRAACMSNLKQVGLAFLQYVQDYDERLPNHGNAANNGSNGTDVIDYMNPAAAGVGFAKPWAPNWAYAIFPYSKSKQILICPSVSLLDPTYTPTAFGDTNYSGNGVILRGAGLAVSAIPNTSDIILLKESNSRINIANTRPAKNDSNLPITGCNGQYKYWHYNPTTPRTIATETYLNNHFAGSNVLFTDGHVKWRGVATIRPIDFGLIAGTGANGGTVNDTVISNDGVQCYNANIP